ncbi:HAD hydrolase family protein [Wukongibacter sp. M2B1]|uniref:HAD hydrolase family protein n=1 Tax=Wukongibacter sp. M2B1 TaxID=3088895 RepID=UPI003D7B60B5
MKATPFSIEIIKRDCNKWNAVTSIAKELNIKVEEIICIGDSENDMHMIENAGLGVAMGNAFSNVKEASDFITYTNEQNGVAHAINRFILKEERLQVG